MCGARSHLNILQIILISADDGGGHRAQSASEVDNQNKLAKRITQPRPKLMREVMTASLLRPFIDVGAID